MNRPIGVFALPDHHMVIHFWEQFLNRRRAEANKPKPWHYY